MVTLWCSWRARNGKVFDQQSISLQKKVSEIKACNYFVLRIQPILLFNPCNTRDCKLVNLIKGTFPLRF
ncbi:hypothetical protein HanIR_Chr06g0280491 [Helianthus annuus]|nr:hypothetical protein HanIR_Chr06g0280491 [Helianthus annuus]